MTYLKLALFIWAIYEVGVTTNLYLYAYREMKRSKIIGALALMLASGLFSLCYRFMFTYLIKVAPQYHGLLQDLNMLPILLMALATRNFRIKSLDPVQVRKEISGNSMETLTKLHKR